MNTSHQVAEALDNGTYEPIEVECRDHHGFVYAAAHYLTPLGAMNAALRVSQYMPPGGSITVRGQGNDFTITQRAEA